MEGHARHLPVGQRAHGGPEGRVVDVVGRAVASYRFTDALNGYASVSRGRRPSVVQVDGDGAGVIDAEIGLGAAGMGLLGMIPTAMFAVWGVLTPIVLRRMGLELLTVLAMLAAGAGQVIRALAHDPWVMGAGSLIALAGMGIGNIVAPPLVKKYFPRHVAAVSMAYITGLQLGTVAPALVAVPVEEAAGWRVSIGWWALLAFVAAIPWIIEILRPGTPTGTPSLRLPVNCPYWALA